MIDLTGKDKAAVLKALYDASRQIGYGFFKAKNEPLSLEEARKLVASQQYFDYLYGRVMKVDLRGDTLDPWLYDHDNGEGAAAAAIAAIKA